MSSLLMLLGRLCLGAIFLLAGLNKFFAWDETVSYMASKGMTFIPFFLICSAVIEIVFSALLIVGFLARTSGLILFLFLIPTTLIFYNFWSVEGVDRNLQIILFLKNLAIMGGLLYVIANGAGSISIDRICCSRCGDKPKA